MARVIRPNPPRERTNIPTPPPKKGSRPAAEAAEKSRPRNPASSQPFSRGISVAKSEAAKERRGARPPKIPPGEILIAPSLLSADFSNLTAAVQEVKRAGCNWLHLDVMDNHFVPNLTFGPPLIAAIRKVAPGMYFDAHLMVTDPASLIDALVAAGVQNVTVHAEAVGEGLPDVLRTIRSFGLNAGVTIKPATAVESIFSVLPLVDIVLVMTVDPGFGGQKLIPSCLNKVRTLRAERERRRLEFLIQVDGGIHSETIALATAAGAEVMVAGSAVFSGKKSVAQNIADLLAAAKR